MHSYVCIIMKKSLKQNLEAVHNYPALLADYACTLKSEVLYAYLNQENNTIWNVLSILKMSNSFILNTYPNK